MVFALIFSFLISIIISHFQLSPESNVLIVCTYRFNFSLFLFSLPFSFLTQCHFIQLHLLMYQCVPSSFTCFLLLALCTYHFCRMQEIKASPSLYRSLHCIPIPPLFFCTNCPLLNIRRYIRV